MLGRQKPTGEKLGIYIHIPFCRSKCDYCDFYSLTGREDQMDRYQKALLAHLKESAFAARGMAPLIPALRWISASWRPTCAVRQVRGQPGLHCKTINQK